MEETKIVVLIYQIQSNPNVSNCQQGDYGTFAKAWALIRLLVHVRAKQMVGVEWRQDNRRKSPDIIQSWLSRQQKVPESCFLFHPAARPLHQPHHQSFSCLPNNAHLYASVIKTQPITIPEQIKRYQWAFQFDNFGHLIQKIELGPRRQDNVPEKILLRRLCVSLLTSDGFLVISEGFLDPTLVRPRHHLHHIPCTHHTPT